MRLERSGPLPLIGLSVDVVHDVDAPYTFLKSPPHIFFAVVDNPAVGPILPRRHWEMFVVSMKCKRRQEHQRHDLNRLECGRVRHCGQYES